MPARNPSTRQHQAETMTPAAHAAHVARLDRYRTPAQPHGDADHAATGLAAELGEALDAQSRTELRGEAGDLLWYATALHQALAGTAAPAHRRWPARLGQTPATARHVTIRTVLALIAHQQYQGHRATPVRPAQLRADLRTLTAALQTWTGTPAAALATANVRKLDQRNAQRTRRTKNKDR